MAPEDRELLTRLAILSKAISVTITPWLGSELADEDLRPDALRLLAADLEGMGRLLRERADEIERSPGRGGPARSLPPTPP